MRARYFPKLRFGLFVLMLSSLGLAAEGQKYSIRSKLEGPQSVYTELLVKLLDSLPPKHAHYPKDGENPVAIECLETPANDLYIGIEQFMTVNRPLAEVQAVLDDIGHYKDLFPDFADIHLVSRDGNKLDIFWEQKIPIFFIPNSKYETVYLIDQSQPGRVIYRYKLKEEHDLKFNDGMIIIESKGPNLTYYTEYDFWDAHWGIAKTLAPGRIWKDSVEGIYLSDVAIKLKAENPNWSYDKIEEESRKILQKHPVDEKLAHKKNFFLWEKR